MICVWKWWHAFAFTLASACVVLMGITLVATGLPSKTAFGQAFADEDEEDDDDRDGHSRHNGWRDFKIEVLSGRPDTIAGGDALVRVSVKKKDARLGDIRIKLNGADISGAFVAESGSLTGLVTGLRLGKNELEVDGQSKGRADIVLVNYPIEGPVFSGPHEEPYACATHQFNLPAGLGPLTAAPIAEPCHLPTRVDYIYRTNATPSVLAQWPAGATTYPSNLAMTATGKPFIIRLETGTVNRAIYQIAILHDPLAQSAVPDWRNPPANWNKRLIYTFGGGCIGGWYRQGASTGGVTDDFMLTNGYALASSSLNVFGNNCNDLTASESMMMVKERFIEAYGPPAHTQGWGCSGGSYAQHQIGDNYPGLLDGIIPGCSFPEVGFATIHFITDSWLLDTYFNRSDIVPWTAEQKRQVTGFLVYNTAPNVAIGARRIDPKPESTSCAAVPEAQRYNPTTNPTGVRCTVYDHTVNVYGKDSATGFARRPLDNEGIQYGLKLVNSGAISVEQFLDLNEKIGGFDKDATIVPQRTIADLIAARAAYETGRLTNGGGGLKSIPIIDYRAYNDRAAGGDIHVRYHSFSMRARLEKADGRSDNQIMLVEEIRDFDGVAGADLYSNGSPLLQRAILTLDRWITAIKADKGRTKQVEKVVRNKPADLQEGCMTLDGTTFIAQPQVRDASTTCEQLYPSNSFPREVAGADIAADIIKCQRKELRQGDYAVSFTAAQWARLESIFPTGVCDWSKRGYEQQGLEGTWLFVD